EAGLAKAGQGCLFFTPVASGGLLGLLFRVLQYPRARALILKKEVVLGTPNTLPDLRLCFGLGPARRWRQLGKLLG
ncbi:hypothetical protein PO909_033646, partial [Leuciscus waleckii]